jgi:MATE family multidrug resistance protein
MFVAILGYVLLRVDRRHYGLSGPIEDFRRLGRTLRRIGYPMAITHGLESGAFSCMTLLAGLLGAVQVAAFQIAMTAIALVFMSAQGFATAASIRVGNAVGRSDPRGVQIAGWTATALACVVLALCALLFSSQAHWVVGWFSSDAEVMAVALVTVTLTGLVLIPDGLQAVLIGALRGMGDVWPAAGLFLIAFWLLMVPAGYILGVWLEYGAAGLIIAILIGTTVAAVFMAWRFQKIARRTVEAL